MIDFKNVNDSVKLKEYLSYAIRSYQSLAERYMAMNDQLISQLAINEITALELSERDSQVKSLTGEIINLYRELGETKYQMSINIGSLIPERDDQLYFEFVDGFKIT